MPEKKVKEFIELSNGTRMPSIGLGTWLPLDEEMSQVKQAVSDALEIGYRHIDTAQIYNTEKDVGLAINEWIAKKKGQRKDVFITTKLWNTFHEKERVEPACKRSLEKLNCEYIDLFLIHAPTAFLYCGDEISLKNKFINFTYQIEDTWRAMEELVKKGLVKSIGVSNFNKRQIDRILKIATIAPVVNQIEASIIFPNQKLIDYCESKGIKIQAYSPFGNPSMFSSKVNLLEMDIVKEMAKKYKKTPAQLCLAFDMQRGLCTLPKSVKKNRIKENFEVFDIEISKDDMKRLTEQVKPIRVLNFEDFFGDHAEMPFHDEF